MKIFSKIVSLIVVSYFFFNTTLLFAQPEPVKELVPLVTKLKPLKSEVLKPNILSRDFDKLLRVDEEIKALAVHLKNKGFVAQKEQKNFWGQREIYEREGKQVINTVRIQDFTKPGSKDVAAIGHITVTAGNRSQTYSFYLFAPNGNFDAMEEYQIDKKLNILKAHSWWSCVKNYIRTQCGNVCLSALTGCAPAAATVVEYIGCVAVRCGGCALKSLGCCACDCSWRCRWAVGCCDR